MMLEAAWAGAAAFSLLGLGMIGCCCPDQQQQQQITITGNDDEEAKRVCPDCGMENPRDANHCGDCGFSFKPTTEDNDE